MTLFFRGVQNLNNKLLLDLRRSLSSTTRFDFVINKFNDIHVKSESVVKFNQENNFDSQVFEDVLKKSLSTWKSEKRSAVWYYLPIHLSHLAVILAKYQFKFHHAENDESVLCKWLSDERESKIPLFATHQMGVAGLAYREDTDQILMVKDRVMIRDFWKLPGGAANLGENIQETAVREVFEETGVRTEFCSVIAFRQQHNYPTAFGRSDLYVICRLKPLTYEINACKDEIKMCEWIDLDYLVENTENNLSNTLARLVKHGKANGFQSIDITPREMSSVFKGKFYNLFFRQVVE